MRQQKFHSLVKEPQEVSASCLNHFSDLAVATNEKFKPRSWLKRTFLSLFYREALLNLHFSADLFFLLTYASASTSVNLWPMMETPLCSTSTYKHAVVVFF